MLDNFLHLGLLFDFYGALLTKRQQECLKMHLYDDLSLSEIATALGISRQAASDMIHRCTAILEKYERGLGLVKRHCLMQNELKVIAEELKALSEKAPQADLQKIIDRLNKIVLEEN